MQFWRIYAALASSMCVEVLTWEGGGMLKWILPYFGGEPTLCKIFPFFVHTSTLWS